MKAAGYARVSTFEQTNGTSLEVQRKRIEDYARLKGIEIAAFFRENGISGGKPIGERPEGSKLMELVESGAVDAVVILKLDRAFRNTVDCLRSVEAWERKGVALHIVDLGGNSMDTASPAGRFMLTVLSAAAEMERGMIRDRCNSGRRARMAQGFRGGEIPYGWEPEAPGSKKLRRNAEEQRTIRRIVRLRDRGLSLRGIAAELTADGVPAKKGGAWTAKQVSRIISRSRV